MEVNVQNLSREIDVLKEKIYDLQEYVEYNYVPWEKRPLTKWEREQLEEARRAPRSECISHEEVKKMIFSK